MVRSIDELFEELFEFVSPDAPAWVEVHRKTLEELRTRVTEELVIKRELLKAARLALANFQAHGDGKSCQALLRAAIEKAQRE